MDKPLKLAYRFLGSSGLKVSNICLGTMTFGERQNGPVQCSEEESHAILDRFAAAGGNFIDTADIYQNGKAEEILGRWLIKQQREKYVIASKVRFGWERDNQNGTGLSRVRIIQAVNDSLHRLQTDYIDLYQIHCWDDGVPIEETMGALNDLIQQGKVRYLGASNLLGWQLQRIIDLTRERNWYPWVSLQQQYSLLCRETEFEVVEVCRREGLGMLPWSPLKGGWLTGKVKQDKTELPPGSRLAWVSEDTSRRTQSHASHQQYATNDKVWNLLDVMRKCGEEQGGRTVAQVALRWLLQNEAVSSVVIGAKTIAQLDDNMGASTGWELTSDQIERLNEASTVDIPYPYEMNWRLNAQRKRPR